MASVGSIRIRVYNPITDETFTVSKRASDGVSALKTAACEHWGINVSDCGLHRGGSTAGEGMGYQTRVADHCGGGQDEMLCCINIKDARYLSKNTSVATISRGMDSMGMSMHDYVTGMKKRAREKYEKKAEGTLDGWRKVFKGEMPDKKALMAAWTDSKKCVKVATGASTGNADMILKVVVAEIWAFIKEEIKWLIHNKCPLIIAQIDNLKSAVEEHPWIKKQGEVEFLEKAFADVVAFLDEHCRDELTIAY